VGAEDLRKFLDEPRESESVTVRTSGQGAVRVIIEGEIDLGRFEELDNALDSAQVDPGSRLEIDLRRVSFMDAQGLRLLVRAQARAVERGHELVIVDPNPFIQHMIEICRLNTMLHISNDETGAT
jgi:anti-anti-sigma factor